MHYIGKKISDVQSLLVDYAKSGRSESYVGRTSEPYLFAIDQKSIEQVAYACGAAHDWRLPSGASRGPIEAPHAYLFYLLNNTRTYRVYEQTIITGLPSGRAQLHAGDDFYYHRPILSGDVLAVTATILPSYRKTGRHGELEFFSDEWRMYNQRNELAAQLIRKAIALDFGESGMLTSPVETRVVLPPDPAESTWLRATDIESAFKIGQTTHVKRHPTFTWMSMMGWLAAVDEYSPTRYDPEFAKSHRYGGGRNIVAGPQLASVMVAALEESLGPDWWISDYENVQRRAVYPNETLISFSKVLWIRDGVVRIQLWLVDEEGVVKGTGEASVKAVTDERKVPAWTPGN